MSLDGRRISIIGAGVAGLAAATALARRGGDVVVYERASALRAEGAGIQISPNGAAVLSALDAQPRALETRAIALRDHRAGAGVLRLELARRRWRHPFLLMHRGDLIDGLGQAAQAAGARFEFGVTADPAALEAELVVMAGGVHAATARQFNHDLPAASFTGQVAWRAVLPEGDAAPEAHVFMGPGRHLVSYPLPGGWRNIVAVEERAAWAAEGWDHPDEPDNLRAAFADFSPQIRAWLDAVEEVKLWGLFRHPVPTRWHDGRSVVIGDAAHPTLPFMAQGANLALEDAWVLADCLQRHDVPVALAAFQDKRRARVCRAITAANANARNYHLRRPALRLAAHTALRLGGAIAPGAALRRFDWLYGHDVTR
ncbi:Salicylate hydroxylase [Candidatus Rhodobacter oscarellae]|uniref:Salicylate hydroxylase n=1 Tax=Candidatus Rhodobacter oscarellae TaxID=1675527 RepID=A0A0J9E2K1_9RHOB|nr:FAD-dependent monooxygenase [Candidatus Rhodobacter lobularis]KMW57086.1 Salicylate hydroxylase [Candidatus Rhodobacter lobularis]